MRIAQRFSTPSAAAFRPARPSIQQPEKWIDRVHWLEWVLVAIAGGTLSYLPWAYGGTTAGSEMIGAALAAVGLLVSLTTRNSFRSDLMETERRIMHLRLTQFPVFWAGLLLVILMTIQGLNPAFIYRQSTTEWWLESKAYVHWLPSGMQVPFTSMNTWHAMLVFSTSWMLVCALWVGLTRRRALVALLTGISLNAFAFAVFGILQRASGTHAIYWARQAGAGFLAAIVYKNHAAAYFGLFGLVTAALAMRLLKRRGVDQQKSNPGVLLMFFALFMELALLLSFSLSGIIVFGGLFCMILVLAVIRYLRSSWRRRELVPFVVTAVMVLTLLGTLIISVGSGDFQQHYRRKISGGAAHSVQTRVLAVEAGWKMFSDRPVAGWGGGCFAYGFTKYQRDVPALVWENSTRLRWENVHDDWLEFLIETGLLGAGIIAFVLVYWCVQIVRLKAWRVASVLPILCGVGAILLYGFFDFPLHNFAIAATTCCLVPILVRWVQLEDRQI